MGNGHQITPINIKPAPPVSSGGQTPVDTHQADNNQTLPQNPKANASLLFNREWQNSQAADLKNSLVAIISGGEKNPTSAPAVNKTLNNSSGLIAGDQKDLASAQKNNAAIITGGEKDLPAASNSFVQRQNEQPLVQTQNGQAKNPLNQTWENLVSLARDRQDLEQFHNQPKEFWDNVRQMSEVRVIETYSGGKLEPRAVSRYGELLEQLGRFGGRMENFLASLPPGEREIFAARFQINQIFGADELFVGRGIAPDKRGEFPLHVFLSVGGSNIDFPAHSILSLLGGNLSAEKLSLLKNISIFSGTENLFNAKSAALLSLSLALYQNIKATISLKDLAPEAFALKTSNELPAPRANAQEAIENEKAKVVAARRSNEFFVIGALINGALATIEKYRKPNRGRTGAWTKSDLSHAAIGFSAGATGAMMGATIGCVVPLAEQKAGEILGFAAGVVTGFTDGGLQTLGAKTLVAVITSGVQSFLNLSSGVRAALPPGAPGKFLNEARTSGIFEDELRQKLFNGRVNAFVNS